jgi:hypothetical protein
LLGEWTPAQQVAALPGSLGEFPFWQCKHDFLPAINTAYQSAPLETVRLVSGLQLPLDTVEVEE